MTAIAEKTEWDLLLEEAEKYRAANADKADRRRRPWTPETRALADQEARRHSIESLMRPEPRGGRRK